MPRGLLIVAVVGLLAAAGVVEGIRTNRWGDSEDIRQAAARFGGVPREVGPWTSAESPIDEKVLRVARAAGHVSRAYTNTKTGAAVSVLLLCGPCGDIAAHTPEYCYAAAGYRMLGREAKQSLALPDGTAVTYWSARFEKPNGEDPLEVSWAWGTDGGWTASENPRREYMLSPALYKLYVGRTVRHGSASGGTADPVTREFLTDFLPELRKVLSRPADGPP